MDSRFDCTPYAYVARALAAKPDMPALQFGAQRWTARFFLDEVARFASFLATLDAREGDVVTLCVPNLPVSVVAFYAIGYLGAVVNVLHPMSPPRAVQNAMRIASSRLLLCLGHIDVPSDITVVSLVGAYMSPLAELALSKRMGRKSVSKSCIRYNPRAQYPKAQPSLRDGGAPALYLPSGGTTGVPKTIVVTGAMLNVSADATQRLSPPFDEGDAMLMVLPIFHGFGIGVCMHCALSGGLRLVLLPYFDADKTVRALVRYGITHLVGVPMMYDKLLQTGRLGKGLRLKSAYSGGDVLGADTKRRFDQAMREAGLDCKLYQGYGLAETVAVCCANSPVQGDVAGSIGRPARGVEMCVWDQDGPLDEGEIGELCVAGDMVMSGYLESTPEGVLVESEGKTWLHTGDYGYCLDGVYYFTGRKKRMSVIAGINVYHQQLEQLAMTVAGVREAVAVECRAQGKPYVKLLLVGDSAALAEVEALFAAHLTRYAIPKQMVFVSKIPHTALGKVDYDGVQKTYAE